MVEEFLSKEESVVADFGDFHLTEDRVIEYVEGNSDREYKDIQLENIASFQHSKHFNKLLAVFGGLVTVGGAITLSNTSSKIPVVIIIMGFIAVIYAFAAADKEYSIHSDTDLKMELPKSSNAKEFWKEINQQKNH